MRIDIVHMFFSLVIIACSSCSGMVYGDDELSSCSSNRSSCEDISDEINNAHDAFTDFTLVPVSHAHSRETDTTNYSQEAAYEDRDVSSESGLQNNWEKFYQRLK